MYENPIRTSNENISINEQQICFARKLGKENANKYKNKKTKKKTSEIGAESV